MLEKYGAGVGDLVKRATSDEPPLTNYAISDIITKGQKHAGKPDVVLSSTLLRAMQTASFLYPDKTVYVAPFIRETSPGPSNYPLHPVKQTEIFYKVNREHGNQGVLNYKFVSGKGEETSRVSWKSAQDIDFNMFIFWLEMVLPYLLTLEGVSEEKKDITVAVAGHSSFMQKYIGSIKKDKPDNVGMVELNFCYKKVLSVVEGVQKSHKILSKINPVVCGCKNIYSLKEEDRQKKPYCDGVVFHGFPTPSKTEFGNGGDNCP
jgi:hypothetical protein